jgi:MFS family permease
MLLWARHSDHTGERKLHLVLPWIVAAVGLFGEACVTDPVQSLGFLTLALMGLYAGVPVFWAIVTERMRRIDGSGGIALVNALGTLGGFVGPFMMGFFVAKNGGIHTGSVLAVFGGLMLVSVVLMLWDFRDRDNGIRVPAGRTGDPR